MDGQGGVPVNVTRTRSRRRHRLFRLQRDLTRLEEVLGRRRLCSADHVTAFRRYPKHRGRWLDQILADAVSFPELLPAS